MCAAAAPTRPSANAVHRDHSVEVEAIRFFFFFTRPCCRPSVPGHLSCCHTQLFDRETCPQSRHCRISVAPSSARRIQAAGRPLRSETSRLTPAAWVQLPCGHQEPRRAAAPATAEDAGAPCRLGRLGRSTRNGVLGVITAHASLRGSTELGPARGPCGMQGPLEEGNTGRPRCPVRDGGGRIRAGFVTLCVCRQKQCVQRIHPGRVHRRAGRRSQGAARGDIGHGGGGHRRWAREGGTVREGGAGDGAFERLSMCVACH